MTTVNRISITKDEDDKDIIKLSVNAYDNVTIQCWALDKNSKPNLVRITDFPAFDHVKLPTL
jgi:hypothetical protein